MEAVLERQMERCWKPVEMEVNRNRNDLRVQKNWVFFSKDFLKEEKKVYFILHDIFATMCLPDECLIMLEIGLTIQAILVSYCKLLLRR